MAQATTPSDTPASGHEDGIQKYVYEFSEGSREMRALLGGKGANIAEMTRVLGADRVPAGFTITTEACVRYMREGDLPEGLEEEVALALSALERRAGKRLGDPEDPLLVSVRSGARDSMPGMMDTVLDLGLGDRAVLGLAARSGDEHFAWDSYRRFVQMFGNVVRGVPGDRLEATIAQVKARHGVALDTDLTVDALKELTSAFKDLFREQTGEDFPQDPAVQLRQAIVAVFGSWMGDRAVAYRRINRIPDDWGTAVNVQQMVYGNMGARSGSGVAFSRDEVTGAPTPSGDFLLDAQGEDVVSGVRNTLELAELATLMPQAHETLLDILRRLEAHFGDMQDVEFTIQDERLYMLQARNAKRPAQAAVRFAVDAVHEGMLDPARALITIDVGRLDALLHPTFDPSVALDVIATGVAASPGAAKGEIVFDAATAVAAAKDGRAVVLVRPFTEADDVAGFFAAKGILTSEGGKASHAALVARGMGRPCVCGASALQIDLHTRTVRIGDLVLREGDHIAINGSTGEITTADVALVEPEMDDNFRQVLAWADELRSMGVRANADTPEDARRAREFGAEGIGLCRTEHMFMAAERQPKMRAMILADTLEGRRAALAELLPMQQADFEGLFEAMAGLTVCIRLLDPPLHEFLPPQEQIERDLRQARARRDQAEVRAQTRLLARVASLTEVNPMLGTRGCRLGILYPEISEMQARAIMRAAAAVRERTGTAPRVEVMVPLVDFTGELTFVRDIVIAVGREEGLELGRDYTVGTMIELPRACLIAGEIAHWADFFSFGTNDLTQTTLGFSRDDIEGSILGRYLELKLVDVSPFESVDRKGVGELVSIAVERGRAANPELEIGVCGEHGGDPSSIEFFAQAGIDYVSCSPFRVPIARVAAAVAAIRQRPAA